MVINRRRLSNVRIARVAFTALLFTAYFVIYDMNKKNPLTPSFHPSSSLIINDDDDDDDNVEQDYDRIHHRGTKTGVPTTQMVAAEGNKAANAVIHIGPHKTGTTAIQHYSKVLYPELVLDKYEMPWKHLKQNVKPWENQVQFATCFTPELEDYERSKYPCRQDLLEAGLNLARQSNHSLLVSAETFAGTKAIGVAELKSYLDQAWSNVTIVATYRRYYEWIVSYHHELNNIKQWAAGTTLWQAIQKNDTERIYPDIQDTLSKYQAMLKHESPTAVIERFKQVFSNVVVMNYHDKSKDLIERFYCNVMPNAPNACKKAIEITKTKGETTKTKGEAKIKNQSYSAVYEELTYAAHRSGMINVHSQKYCEAVTTAIKAHQEKTLKLSSDDFPRACPSSKVLDEIWDITLHSEKDFNKHVKNGLNYEGEGSLLSTGLKDDFDAYARDSLCHVDVHSVLQSPVWRDFFAEVKGNGECNMGYLNKYPDVANAVGKKKQFQSGFVHWVMYGKKEGREPSCREWTNYILVTDEA